MTNSKKVGTLELKPHSKGIDYVNQKYGVDPVDLSKDFDGLYSIYDKVQKVFLPPFPQPTREACNRTIVDMVNNNKGSLLAKYPSDYELYILAYWSDKTGHISLDVPTRLCNIYELLNTSRKDKYENDISDKV